MGVAERCAPHPTITIRRGEARRALPRCNSCLFAFDFNPNYITNTLENVGDLGIMQSTLKSMRTLLI